MMILVGLWQHMFLGDWPFQDLPQPARGIIETFVNLALVWLVIHVIFYRVLGLGFNFLSQSNLEDLASGGSYIAQFKDAAGAMVTCGRELSLEKLVAGAARYGERAVVCFVLIGFFSYPFVTILFGKWPVRPSDLKQPMAGLAEFGWCSMWTMFFLRSSHRSFFWNALWKNVRYLLRHELPLVDINSRDSSCSLGIRLVGMDDRCLFMTPNVWRMKPWSAIKLAQPLKGLVSFLCIVVLGYIIASACVKFAPSGFLT